jgi:uncharacterized membrane protein
MSSRVGPSPSESRAVATGAAAGLFLVCWGVVHEFFWAQRQLVDWPVYLHYGYAIVHDGRIPYRDFPVEYPPGALPVFALPSLGGTYASSFAWLMAACGVALVVVVAGIRRGAAFYVALAPVLAGSLILSRFDLWPALLATAALAALLRDRDGLGWALLGAAVAAKLWPLVIVPVALVWSVRRGHKRAPFAGLAVTAAIFIPFAVIAPSGLWSSITGQLSRPLQIESLGAAVVTTFGHPGVVTTHGSQNLTGHGAVGAGFAVAQVAVLVALWVGFARGGPMTRERLIRFAAAAVCAFVAFGKVLSPQFLLWLVPLVPLVAGRRGLVAASLLTAALVLTQVWFPERYWAYATGFHLAWVVLLRDLVLVALVGVLASPNPVRTSSGVARSA